MLAYKYRNLTQIFVNLPKNRLILKNSMFSLTFYPNLFYTDISIISVTFCNSACQGWVALWACGSGSGSFRLCSWVATLPGLFLPISRGAIKSEVKQDIRRKD